MLPLKQKQIVECRIRKASFSDFVLYKPNLITLLRIAIILLAVDLYRQGYIFIPLSTTLLSVALDYVDGMAARFYGECSFFG